MKHALNTIIDEELWKSAAKRAMDNKLSGENPDTITKLIEEALREYFEKHLTNSKD